MDIGMGIMYMLAVILVSVAGLIFLIGLDVSPGWTLGITLGGIILFIAFMTGATQ